MRKLFLKIGQRAKNLAQMPFKKSVLMIMVVSLILSVVIESFARGSVIPVVVQLFTSPLIFAVNFLIVFFTLSLSLLVKKRIPLIVFLSALWLGFGIANAVVLSTRANPLGGIDLLVLKSAITMLPIYFNIVEIILMAALILGAVALVVFLFIKFPKSKVVWHKSLICIGITFVVIWLGSTIIAATNTDTGDDELADIYEKYGFAFCFSNSLVSHGVEKPNDYDRDTIGEIMEVITPVTSGDETEAELRPNIIFVQLESFFDPTHVVGLEYSTAPTPNFAKLKSEGVSGYLSMESIGGGTANSEFEILTGMNLEHFGLGEYPYTTALKTRACESIAANLKKIGYSTHAMHNHIADFYGRDTAYASLGFDTFTPVEMMRNVTRNPLGFAKDEVLTDEILSALDSTESRDFVFAVSVQAHGKYPLEEIESDMQDDGGYEDVGEFISDEGENVVEITGISDKAIWNQFTYYVNQVHEMDMFIGELTAALEKKDEPTMVVFYGDHMPTLPLTDDDVTNGDIYETEYAVWCNYTPTEFAEVDDINSLDKDFEAYMLAAYVQKLCGMSIGNITKLHQYELTNGESNDEYLRTLEYAQLYDKDTGEYTMSDMKWGTRPITVSSYQKTGNTLYVTGEGFNPYSKVVIGGIRRSTVYINEHTLAVENLFFDAGKLAVVQVASGIGEIYRAEFE